MHNLYRDQLAMKLRKAFSLKNGWDDVNGALEALNWFYLLIESKARLCPEYSKYGCSKIESHPECRVYRDLLADLTPKDSR